MLTKKYLLTPDLVDDQPTLSDIQVTAPQWKAGKNLTVTEVQKKQKAKAGKNKGQVRVITKQLPKASFFQFFKSPLQGEDEEEEENAGKDEEEEDDGGPKKKFLPEEDYDVAHAIRTLAVPEAVLLFTGEKDLTDMYGDVSASSRWRMTSEVLRLMVVCGMCGIGRLRGRGRRGRGRGRRRGRRGGGGAAGCGPEEQGRQQAQGCGRRPEAGAGVQAELTGGYPRHVDVSVNVL